ncbi:MAG: phosphatidylinositol mannoside acyltransferase [Acidimicrobiia bacterium]|nr:phosphatidylinositol mannoside acyltransferase [Acidimicrobiia bacterium]
MERAYKLGVVVVGLLPLPLARALGSSAGWLAWLWADKRKHNAIRAMARVRGEDPDRPSPEAISSARRLFAGYGRYWAEVFWLRPGRVARVHASTTAEGLEYFRAALAEGKGVILALPHCGNWEVAGPVAKAEQAELIAVAEQLGSEEITTWFVALRASLAIDIVLADGTSNVMRALLAGLKRNAAIALLSDRDLSGKGEVVEFFGERTALPTGAVRLAKATGAPILPVGSFFSKTGHAIVVDPPLLVGPDESLNDATQRLAAALEVVIRRHPEQWHMVQPNWPSDLIT